MSLHHQAALPTIPGLKLHNLVTTGGLGAIYCASMPCGQKVAVKMVRDDFASDAKVTALIQAEAQILSRVRHRHVPAFVTAGVTDGRPYLAMEWLEGETLADMLRRQGPMHPKRLLELLAPVFAAVAVCHATGVVHADIKPSNIMLGSGRDGTTRAFLIDFGCAQSLDGPHPTDELFGSPGFVAPELLRDGGYSIASDIYALGVVLFEALTGGLPFEGDMLEVYRAQRAGAAPLLSDIHPGLPRALDGVIAAALASDPTRRFVSALHMRDSFQAALSTNHAPTKRSWWSFANAAA